MVDVNKLRLKFPPKKKGADREKSRAAMKAIAREFERKRSELGLGSSLSGRHGFSYYMLAIVVMLVVGAFVVPLFMKDGSSVVDRSAKNLASASNAVSTLAVALGRYRYDTGTYPTTEQGLAMLAYKLERPELQRVPVEGWNGPYIKKLLPDPWRNAYVYDNGDPMRPPVIYSCGPDGKPGTPDDIIADPGHYDEPFRDTSWKKGWVPQYLRGYVVAQNAAHRRQLEADLEEIRRGGPDPRHRVIPETLQMDVVSLSEGSAALKISYDTMSGHVETELAIPNAVPWTPRRPAMYPIELGGELFAVPLRTVERDGDGNLLLNGAPFTLKGVSLDGISSTPLAALIESRDGFERLLKTVSEAGANAIGGWSFTPLQLELCDRNGLIPWEDSSGFVSAFPDIVDAAGFPSSRAAAIKARWDDSAETVALHPHWNWKSGDTVVMRCETSGDEAELFVNDISAGRKSGSSLEWSVPWEFGTVKAIAYRNGAYIGEASVSTAGKASKLRLSSGKQALDLGETLVVSVECLDDDGRFVPDSDALVTFSVDGPGEITTALNSYGETADVLSGSVSLKLSGGRAVLAVKRKSSSGADIHVWAKSAGLASDRMVIRLVRGESGQ
ncbi:MAG: type II secretion system protein GspG [Kiritimatiellae bacterium]|nr:type II secretion system protein GspG [Kiritimatiellia bacterium]